MMPGPIFIVGAPRSGTTLLRNVLNRHPAIGLCDETYYFYYVYARRRAFGDLADEHRRRRLVERYLSVTRIARLRLDPQDLSAALMRDGTSYPSFFATLLQCYAAARGKRRWGEKTPQHAESADTLCEWYPDCTLLHLVRDPRDVVASLLRMPWGQRTAVANAQLWQQCVDAAERCRERPNFLRIVYERLVSEPEAEIQRVCSFIGEDYDPGILAADDGSRAEAWWFERAQGDVSTSRIATWHDQLTPLQVSLIEDIAGARMREFGYSLSGRPLSAAARSWALTQDRLERAREKLRGLPRLWYHWVQPTQLAAEEAWIDRNH